MKTVSKRLKRSLVRFPVLGVMSRLFVVVCILVSFVTGCSKTVTNPHKEVRQEKVLLIGLIPEANIFRQMERYEPLVDYLSKRLAVKIELKVLPQYGDIVDNFISLGLDGAFLGSFTYVLLNSHLHAGLEVLARPVNLDGESTYHGLLLVRKDSGIRTAKDMRGKTFAFVDRATTAGYLFPLEYFKKHGIKDYRAYFKETYFAGTHEDAILDVLDKKADIGAAKNTVYERLAKTDVRIIDELIILDTSPDVPENGLALRKDLDDSIKKRLRAVLLTMHNDPLGRSVLTKFGAQKFISTTDKDYEPVLKYAREIGLDLATYDYRND